MKLATQGAGGGAGGLCVFFRTFVPAAPNKALELPSGGAGGEANWLGALELSWHSAWISS